MATTTNDYPTTSSLIQQALDFIRQQLVRNGIPTSSAKAAVAVGGERWMTMSAFANCTTVVLANAVVKEDATMPDSATGDDLDRLAGIYGIVRSRGAGAQGDVTVTCTGTVSFAAGTELTGNSGKRYKVVSPTTVTNGGAVSIVGIDVGKSTNAPAGTVLTWTSPPPGCATTCTVASGGLVDGKDADNDQRLRQRLLERLQKPQNGGNWSHYRKWAEDASAAVQAAYVYPAAQGPATVHLAYTIEGSADNAYARSGTPALTAIVAGAVVAQQPEHADVTVTTVNESELNVALKLILPEPVSTGGAGGGWIDENADRWAIAKTGAGNVDGVVQVTAVTTADVWTVNAYNTPVAGSTIQVFSSGDRKVYVAKVVTVSGAAGNWTITLDRALSSVTSGDSIFPACEQAEVYATQVLEYVATLAPGEKTSLAAVLPRAYRHPKTSDGAPSGVTTTLVARLQDARGEISNAEFFYLNSLTIALPLEPSVPAAVTDPPNVWRVKRLAFYPAN